MTTVRREALKGNNLGGSSALVSCFERRYEVSSAEMDEAVRTKRVKETAEIGHWLTIYRRLAGLHAQQQIGHMTGTHIKIT